MDREAQQRASSLVPNSVGSMAGRETPIAPVVRCREVSELALLYEPEVLLVTAGISTKPAACKHAAALAKAGERVSKAEAVCVDGEARSGSLDALTLKGAEGADAWAEYVGEVAGVFALLVGARVVGVRQVVADGPHCPRFHVDRVAVRGVLTVLGPGTEWLPNSDLERERLGHAGGDDDATSGLVKSWDRLEHAEPGSLAVFKGTAWPGIENRAVVHRSPPADGTRRVVLTLDWLA